MADEAVESVKRKTCILRASIHCEGCKRKVKKILSQVQGVEFVDVDTKQHKVTVTGDVNAEILIKKLIKSGKNAQLWPQISEKRENITGNGKKKKEKEIETSEGVIHAEAEAEAEAEAPPASASENGKASIKTETDNTTSQGSAAPVKAGEGHESGGGDAKPAKARSAIEIKPEEKKSGESCSTAAEAPEKKEAVPKSNDDGGGVSESGTSVKKKKKKGQTGKVAASVHLGLENPEAATNQSPPFNHQFPFMPPQPVYAVSYNTAYPASSSTASYYAAPPSHAYAYMHPGREMEPPPLDPELNLRQPLDSFEMFSDENPNGCFIM